MRRFILQASVANKDNEKKKCVSAKGEYLERSESW
jgi:hypothetical protein